MPISQDCSSLEGPLFLQGLRHSFCTFMLHRASFDTNLRTLISARFLSRLISTDAFLATHVNFNHVDKIEAR